MFCFYCLAAAQAGSGTSSLAVTIYNGTALCGPHVNLTRGLPFDFGATAPTIEPAAAPSLWAPPPPDAPPDAAPVASAATPAPAAKTGHETCTDCAEWPVTHYADKGVDHCGCGAHMINGWCEVVLESQGKLGDIVESLAPGR
jgi:hypothetical protein